MCNMQSLGALVRLFVARPPVCTSNAALSKVFFNFACFAIQAKPVVQTAFASQQIFLNCRLTTTALRSARDRATVLLCFA